MQLYLINTKKPRNINQLHINTFTYQKKLRTFKTKTANIYQCFFLGTNKAEYPTIYSLYFLYYYLKSDLKYRKYVPLITLIKKEKFQDSNMLCNFKRYKKARVSSIHCFGAEVYSLKNGFYGIYGTARWSPFLQCRRMHHILPMLQTQQGVNTKNRKATRIRDF